MITRRNHRLSLPIAALCAVMIMATANIAMVQSSSALSLGEFLSSLLGGNKETKPTVSPSETAPAQSTTTPTTTTPPATTTTQQPATSTTTPATNSTQSSTPAKSNAASTVTPTTTPTQSAQSDTAAATLTTASGQAQKSDSSVQYSSARIGDDTRDRLYAVAGSVAVIGTALYSMTLLQIAPRRQPVAARRPLYIKQSE